MDNFKKRDSIFSNGSINGFNSALFLASEFNADSDSEAWIPINEANESKSTISNITQNQNDNSIYDSTKKITNLIRNDEESILINKYMSPVRPSGMKLNSLNAQRRFSTPLMIPDKNGLSLVDRLKAKNTNQFQSKKSSIILCSEALEIKNANTSAYLVTSNDTTQVNTASNLKSNLNSNSNLENSNVCFPYQNNLLSVNNTNKNPSYISNKTINQSQHKTSYFPIQPVNMNTMVFLNLLNIKEKKISNVQTNPVAVPLQQSSKFNSKKKVKKTKEVIREGDWICVECQNLNFSFRTSCNKCSYEKKEG